MEIACCTACVTRLQRVHNPAARLIPRTKKDDHITAVLTVDVSKPSRPSCIILNNLLIRYRPTRALRAADAHLLEVPRCMLHTQGEQAFSSAAPRHRNNIPLAMRATDCHCSFKKLLKTLLFVRAFLH